ncbi:L-threonine aldolase [Faunimonas pinastri]|uniref:L-threonine aldolase n=1 Tax=Faunimonas pinastri TaxID=1855383 RepID=A0A1H9P5R6_9HYPH|nr:low specificity L-threonine aldolase [Faunimonas pinastri]SER43169.1 L-threonine aldolase [Faunimonas pinastri]
MFFASDNWAGAHPAIIDAMAREAGGYAAAYGASEVDRRAEAVFSTLFEREVAVFFVGTGTAANSLALAAMARPGGLIFCHAGSHVVEDECGAVEFQSGNRLFHIAGPDGKISPEALEAAFARFTPEFVHAGRPVGVTITQGTEAGTAYSVDEVRRLAEITHAHGLPLHMDGARFANALMRSNASAAEMTWKAGVDLMSFGGTKNGCIEAEAIVVFEPARFPDLPFLRKRAGHLFSKTRFIAAQFEAYLQDGLWRKLASHANDMADRLRTGFHVSAQARIAWTTDTNEVFAILTKGGAERARAAGAVFYDWHPPAGTALGADEIMIRLVTSFATTAEDVAGFLAALG